MQVKQISIPNKATTASLSIPSLTPTRSDPICYGPFTRPHPSSLQRSSDGQEREHRGRPERRGSSRVAPGSGINFKAEGRRSEGKCEKSDGRKGALAGGQEGRRAGGQRGRRAEERVAATFSANDAAVYCVGLPEPAPKEFACPAAGLHHLKVRKP